MAVIGELRTRFGLVVSIVIGLSLLGFLLMTALESQTNLFKGQSTTAAKIDGTKIDAQDYFNKVNINADKYQMFQGKAADEQTMNSIREQTWNEVIQNEIMEKKYDELGIQVSIEEMKQQCGGNNPHDVIRRQFVDQKTQQYNPALVTNFFNTQYKDNKNDEQKRWGYIEDFIREDRFKNKFNALIKKAIYAPKWLCEMNNNDQQARASIAYCSYPYTKIADDQVKPTDDELKNYIAQNPKKYKQEASVKIEYIEYPIVPSKDDSMSTFQSIAVFADSFKRVKNDSLFVMANSENDIDGNYYANAKINSSARDVLANAPVGTVVGPYLDGGFYKLSKVAGRKIMPDSVRARHILVKVAQGADTAAANRSIDSMRAMIRAGVDFGSLAFQKSQDEGSKDKGGDLGYFAQGMMVPEFNNACFNGKTGDVVKVVTNFGVHLIQITDQKNLAPATKVYSITKSLNPSKFTEQAIFTKANQFAAAANTGAKFDKEASTANITKKPADNIKKSDSYIAGLGSARDIVKWAYSAKKDDVSSVFNIEGKLIIAKLVAIRQEGLQDLDAIRPTIEGLVRRDKKAAKIMADFESKISGKNITEVASILGDTLHNTDVNFMNPYLPMGGQEPVLVGAALGSKPNTVSKLIKGESGVYVFTVKSVTPVTAPTKEILAMQKSQFVQQNAQSVDYMLPESLKKQIKIVDNRGDFF